MTRRVLVATASMAVVLLLTLAGSSPRTPTTGRSGPQLAAPGHFAVSPADSARGPISVGNGVSVGVALKHDTSPRLRDIPPRPVTALPADEENDGAAGPDANAPHAADTVVQSSPAAPAMPATNLSFEGIDYPGVACTCAPPDTNGEPGATQYVQIVNEGYQVFDKTTGASVLGPVGITTIWSGFGGLCETSGRGDPVVLYDQFANRWVVSQFAGSPPTDECIAVSTTSDATGAYHRFDFVLGTNFFDYPKLAVWPDGYYMSDNVFNPQGTVFLGPQPFVFDRSLMLTGGAATFQTTANLGNSVNPIIPADVDGSTPPPANAPETFVRFPGAGHYDTYHYHVNWVTPASSTFTSFATPSAAAFTQACGSCVPQLDTTSTLGTLADRLMFRLAYRNFGDHESVVGSYTVASGGVTGVRWFELRNVTAGPETVFQESTYQPDTTYRWMSSAAMDHNGDIAVGFSASSLTIYPELRYAGRLAGDTLGTLGQGEATLYAGTGSQNGTSSRWGDYSDMTVDPVDDCTFWYTSEYYAVPNSQFNWRTRIGSFTMPGCGAPPVPTVVSFAPTTSTPTNAATVSYALTFNESVTGLSAGDFNRTGTATGCSVGAPSGSGASYTVAVTGCSEGTVVLTLNANTVTDSGSAVGPALPSTASTVTIDRTAPTATLTPPSSPTNATTLSYTAGFNESVTGVAAGDFAVTGTATGCVIGAPSGSGASRTIALTSCSAGTVVLTLKAGSVTDLAGNPGPASDVVATSVTIDRTAPTASLTPPASPTNAATLTYGVGFSESVTGLAAGDFTRTGTATGCTVGAPSGSGASYTVGVTGCSDGTVVLTLKAGTVTDLAGNPGPASDVTATSVTISRSGPSVTSFAPTTASPTNSATISYALTFDESVTGLAAGDFSRTGTASSCVVGAPSGSGASYTIDVTSCSEGSVILTLNSGTVVDLASNAGPASPSTATTVTIDRTGPTATLTPPASPTNAATLTYTASFNETVTGVVAGDFAVTGTATGCVVGAPSGSGASRTVALTSCSAGTVVLTLTSGSVLDLAGNPGPGSNVSAASVTIDRTAPTASLTPPASPTNAATLTYGVGFSESVTGLAAGDFTETGTATGCSVGSPTGSAASYSVAVTGCSDGTVVLTLKAGTVSDLAGNAGPSSDVAASSVTINRSGPVVTSFAPTTASPTNAATISYSLTFDESVTGLAAGDFGHSGTAIGCSVGAPSGSGASYTVAVTGCSDGTLALTLNANTVSDVGSNVGPTSPANALTVTIDRTAPTTGAPAGSLQAGVVLNGASLPLALAWTAADTGGSGLATYDVARSLDGAAFVVIATGVASPTVSTTTSSGHTYRFEVRAHDHAGNIGGWVAGSTLKPSLLQQTSSSIGYHLTWTSSTYASFSGGSVKYATAAGAYATYTFTGRGIAFVTTLAASRGAVRIYIDGVLITTIDCYAPTSTFRYVAFAQTWASVGTHRITIKVVGTAGRPRVDLDALEVMR